MQKNQALWIALFFTSVLTTQVYSQAILRSVVSNGATSSQNSEMMVVGSVGQLVIGTVTDYENEVHQGFWNIYQETSKQNTDNVLTYGSNMLNIAPHPITNQSVINYTAKELSTVRIELYTMLGEYIKTLYNQSTQGLVEVPFTTDNLSNGQYTVRVTTETQQQSMMVIIQK